MDERARLVEELVNHLVGAGATVHHRHPGDLEGQDAGGYFVLMRDPEGNEFCVA